MSSSRLAPPDTVIGALEGGEMLTSKFHVPCGLSETGPVRCKNSNEDNPIPVTTFLEPPLRLPRLTTRV